ncbi:MAG: hypothetical protein A2293_13110 [Elusimicrobia bacterium RIFOXYB2_FULL_49_7]|nr:MAG: hypothetical protein A2293_13110 [Elusimicrobia bacterium RIFOXYB2_FULL_49_7]
MKIRILQSAQEDLVNGYHFYESQKNGLGVYFLDTLFSDIDSLQLYAGIHPIFFKKYHRMLSKRFPFSIYYHPDESTIIVVAVLDCRHRPAWIKVRIKSHP